MTPKQTLLIVGPKGTGGIDRYITEQRRYLEDRMDVRVYTRYTAPKGEGLELAALHQLVHEHDLPEVALRVRQRLRLPRVVHRDDRAAHHALAKVREQRVVVEAHLG